MEICIIIILNCNNKRTGFRCRDEKIIGAVTDDVSTLYAECFLSRRRCEYGKTKNKKDKGKHTDSGVHK